MKAETKAPARKESLNREQVVGLAAMSVSILVVANDFTSLSVALPAIEESLHTDVTTVQWLITGFALVFGVLIVSCGRLADMFGRRRIFFLGAIVFAVASALAGMTSQAWELIAARLIMGVGGAMMWPSVLGMTFAMVPPDRQALAGSVVIGSAGIGNAAGPLLGGVLTDTVGWRWIFFLNVFIATAAFLITWLVVKDDTPQYRNEKIDFLGVGTLSVCLLALLLALDIGTDAGWTDPLILGLFGMSIVFGLVFTGVERRAGDNALLPDNVVANREFLAAGVATLMMSAIFFAALLYLPQFMTKQLGFSALESGAGLLPMMLTFALSSFVAGPLYEKLGPRIIVSLGAIALASGMFMLSDLTRHSTFADLIPGMVVLGVGIGLFYSSITTVGISALKPEQSSLAGAIIYMFQIAGGSIGLGLNTAIVVSSPALASGINRAFEFNGLVALLGLIVALTFIRGRSNPENDQPENNR